MATFLTNMTKKGYTQKEVFDRLFESEQDRKRRRMQAIAIETVAAHRLQQMRDLLTFEKLATWRRMDDFDRIAADDNLWASRQLPLTPEQFIQNLWFEVNALKAAISMPAGDTMTRPWQKTIDFVDGLKGKLPEEELAVIKEYVEKRSRDEAAQTQVTVTPIDTVHHCSPCSPNPDMPSGVYFRLENTEDEMGPELEELEPPSAGTGLKTPGQQCPPNEGICESGRTTASGILTAGAGPSQGENNSSPMERMKSTTTVADIFSKAATPSKRRHKTFSEQNKQFDLGGRREKAPLRNEAVTLLSFSAESWEASCLCFVFSVSALCVLCFPNYFSFPGDHFSAKLKDTRGDQGSSR